MDVVPVAGMTNTVSHRSQMNTGGPVGLDCLIYSSPYFQQKADGVSRRIFASWPLRSHTLSPITRSSARREGNSAYGGRNAEFRVIDEAILEDLV